MPMQLSPCLLPNRDVYCLLFSTWCTADALMVDMNKSKRISQHLDVFPLIELTQQELQM